MTNASRPHDRLWPIISTLILGQFVSSLEGSMLYPAMPAITREFGSLGSASWLITGYMLVSAVTVALAGRLGDIYGRRNVLIAVLLICAAGSAMSMLSHGLVPVAIGRAIQGVAAGVLPLTYGIARAIMPKNQSAFWVGVLTGAYMASAALGYVLGGALADIGQWRMLFLVNGALSLLVAAGLQFVLPADRAAKIPRTIDWLGGLLFLPAIALLLFAIQTTKHWSDPRAFELIGAGLLLLIVWVTHELRHSDPLFDVRLLANRQIAMSNVVVACLGLGGLQLALVLMLLLQQPVATGVGLGLSGVIAGTLKIPSSLISGVSAPFSGYLGARGQLRLATILGGLANVIAWAWLAFHHDTFWNIMVGTMVAGFGSAMLMAAVPNLVLEAAPPERSSEATGVLMVTRTIFNAIGAQIVAAILASSVVVGFGRGPMPTEQAYVASMAFIAATSLAIVLVACFLPSPRAANAGAMADAVGTKVRSSAS